MEKMTKNMQVALADFIKDYSPKTLKRNLLSIFFEYVYSVNEMIPNNLCNEVSDFKGLLKFLDTLEDELEQNALVESELLEESVKA